MTAATKTIRIIMDIAISVEVDPQPMAEQQPTVIEAQSSRHHDPAAYLELLEVTMAACSDLPTLNEVIAANTDAVRDILDTDGKAAARRMAMMHKKRLKEPAPALN
jgi:hypothetical protein